MQNWAHEILVRRCFDDYIIDFSTCLQFFFFFPVFGKKIEITIRVFEVLSQTLDLFGCVHSPWFSFVCDWPWHEGAGRIGQSGAG